MTEWLTEKHLRFHRDFLVVTKAEQLSDTLYDSSLPAHGWGAAKCFVLSNQIKSSPGLWESGK